MEQPGDKHDRPCQTCGACCASSRVSFYWGEADDAPGGIVPAHLTETVSPHLFFARGIWAWNPGIDWGCKIRETEL